MPELENPAGLPAGAKYVRDSKSSGDPIYDVPGVGLRVFPRGTSGVWQEPSLRAPTTWENVKNKVQEGVARATEIVPPLQFVTGMTPKEVRTTAKNPLLEAAPNVAAMATSLGLGAARGPLLRGAASALAGAATKFGTEKFQGVPTGEATKSALGEGLMQGAFEVLPGVPRGVARLWAQGGLNAEAKTATKLLGRRITNREVFEWATRNGFDLTVPEAAEKAMAKAVQDVFESSLFAGQASKSRWARSHAAAEDLIDRSRVLLGKGAPEVTSAEMGEALKGNLDTVWTKVQGRFRDAYQKVWNIDPTAIVSMKGERGQLQLAAASLREKLRIAPILKDSIGPAIEILENAEKTAGITGIMPLPLAQDVRSDLWSSYRQAMKNPETPSVVKKTLKDVAQSMDTSILSSLEKSNPAQAKAWKTTKEAYASMIRDFESAQTEAIARTESGKVGRKLASLDSISSADLNKVLGTWGKDVKARDAMRVGYLNEIIKDPDVLGGTGVTSIADVIKKQTPSKMKAVLGSDKTGKAVYEDLVMLGEMESRINGLMKDKYAPKYPAMRVAWYTMDLIAAGLSAVKVAGGGDVKGISGTKVMEGLGVEAALTAILFNRSATRSLLLSLSQAPYRSSLAVSNAARAIRIALQLEEEVVKPALEASRPPEALTR